MKKAIVGLLVIALMGTFMVPITLAQNASYTRGMQDGKEAAREDVNQFVEGLWGVLFGVFAVIHAYMTEADVMAKHRRQLRNKSNEYQRGYIKGYKTIMGKKVMGARLLGLATYALLLFPITSSS